MFVWMSWGCGHTPEGPVVPPDPLDSGTATTGDTGTAPTSPPTGTTGDTGEVEGDPGYVVTVEIPGVSGLPQTAIQQTPDGPRVLLGAAGYLWVFDAAPPGDKLLATADAAWPYPTLLFAGVPDVDGDGTDDVWTGYETPTLQSGTASGTVFGTFEPGIGSTGYPPTQGFLAPGDLDGDGLDDVMTSDYDRGFVFWAGPHTGQTEPAGAFEGQFPPAHLVAADFTGDGLPDVYGQDEFRGWLISDPPRGRAPVEDVAVARFTTEILVNGTGAGDLDGDGAIDLVVTTADKNTWVTNEVAGNVDLDASAVAQLTTNKITSAVTLAIADYDGDGQDDVALGGSTFIQQYKGHSLRSLWVVHGPLSGEVDLETAGTVRGYGPYTAFAERTTAGDIDGDGEAELLASGSLGNAFDPDKDETVWVFYEP